MVLGYKLLTIPQSWFNCLPGFRPFSFIHFEIIHMKKIQFALSLSLFASVGLFGCRMSTPPAQQDGSFSSSGTPVHGAVAPNPYKPDWSGQPAAVRAAIAVQD